MTRSDLATLVSNLSLGAAAVVNLIAIGADVAGGRWGTAAAQVGILAFVVFLYWFRCHVADQHAAIMARHRAVLAEIEAEVARRKSARPGESYANKTQTKTQTDPPTSVN
jgi:hypothetical protein